MNIFISKIKPFTLLIIVILKFYSFGMINTNWSKDKSNSVFSSIPLSSRFPNIDQLISLEKKHFERNELIATPEDNLTNDSMSPKLNNGSMRIYPIAAGFSTYKVLLLDSIPDKSEKVIAYKVAQKKRITEKRYFNVKSGNKNNGLEYSYKTPLSQLLYPSQAGISQLGFTPSQLLSNRLNDKSGVSVLNTGNLNNEKIPMAMGANMNIGSYKRNGFKDDNMQKNSPLHIEKIKGNNFKSSLLSIESTIGINENRKINSIKRFAKKVPNQGSKSMFLEQDNFYETNDINISHYLKSTGVNLLSAIKQQEKIKIDLSEIFKGKGDDVNYNVAISARSKSLLQHNKIQSRIGSYRNSSLHYGRKSILGYSMLGDDTSLMNDKLYQKLVHKSPASNISQLEILKISEKKEDFNERNYLDKFLNNKLGETKSKYKSVVDIQQAEKNFHLNKIKKSSFKSSPDNFLLKSFSNKLQNNKKKSTSIDLKQKIDQFRKQDPEKNPLPLQENTFDKNNFVSKFTASSNTSSNNENFLNIKVYNDII